MKFKNLSFLVLFLMLTQVQSQNIGALKRDFYLLNADYFAGFDGFNSYYYIKDNVLYKKYETTIIQYQNLAFGKIKKVDLLNPLKIVIFYSDFNTVVVLDNQLNEIQKIEFSRLETPIIASSTGISGQNKLWFFNTLNQQIGLYDLTTNQHQYIGAPIRDSFTYYQTDFNYFEFVDKNNLWNTYTIFGRFFQNGPVENAVQLQLLNDKKYIYYTGDSLVLKDNKNNTVRKIDIVEKSIKKFFYKDQILSIFTDQGITNYKITIP